MDATPLLLMMISCDRAGVYRDLGTVVAGGKTIDRADRPFRADGAIARSDVPLLPGRARLRARRCGGQARPRSASAARRSTCTRRIAPSSRRPRSHAGCRRFLPDHALDDRCDPAAPCTAGCAIEEGPVERQGALGPDDVGLLPRSGRQSRRGQPLSTTERAAGLTASAGNVELPAAFRMDAAPESEA